MNLKPPRPKPEPSVSKNTKHRLPPILTVRHTGELSLTKIASEMLYGNSYDIFDHSAKSFLLMTCKSHVGEITVKKYGNSNNAVFLHENKAWLRKLLLKGEPVTRYDISAHAKGYLLTLRPKQ